MTTSSRVCALFTEIPSNPLLKIPDMHRLQALARKHNFLLIVDDTISGFAQVDLLSGKPNRRDAGRDGSATVFSSEEAFTSSTSSTSPAPAPVTEEGVRVDLLCSSLTKIFSGRGNVLAGSLVVNSAGPRATMLKKLLQQETAVSPTIFPDDMKVLAENSRNYEQRCLQIMQVTYRLACWLRERPEVETVWHPCFFNEKTLGNTRIHSVLRQRRLNEVRGEPGLRLSAEFTTPRGGGE